MNIKLILTGATGLVGEGVLLECLQHPAVEQVLVVRRRHYDISHPKLRELIVPDFFHLDDVQDQLTGYDACLYCAGISSAGMSEKDYSYITYETVLHFAGKLLKRNPNMIFSHVSGSLTDSSEKGRIMWARVKGKTENALMRMPFRRVYNFRPGFMKPTPGQKNIKGFYKVLVRLSPVFKTLMPGQFSTMKEVGLAMINSILRGYPKQVLEVKDIRLLAAE
jgi:uncharacterized protein YbjT (DUF2867 family)